jgi:hypothetical protein
VNAVAPTIAADARVDAGHPAIDDALLAYPLPVARRAADVIRAGLAARVASAPADSWRGSRLTGDGFPFELSFCTADDRLRCTLEPGASDLAPRQRLEAAIGVLQRLIGDSPPPGIADACRGIQRSRTLKYGAWIGARVVATDCAFKLYVEAPGDDPPAAAVPPVLTLPDRPVSTRMVAYSPPSGTIETYVSVPSLEPRHLAAALAPAGLENRAAELLDVIRDMYGYAIRGRVPGPSVGVSYVSVLSFEDDVGMRGTTLPRASVYLFARSLWGSDAGIRQQFLRCVRAYAWNADTYERVTAPLARRDSWQTRHGLVCITLERSAIALAIGVRPVSS